MCIYFAPAKTIFHQVILSHGSTFHSKNWIAVNSLQGLFASLAFRQSRSAPDNVAIYKKWMAERMRCIFPLIFICIQGPPLSSCEINEADQILRCWLTPQRYIHWTGSQLKTVISIQWTIQNQSLKTDQTLCRYVFKCKNMLKQLSDLVDRLQIIELLTKTSNDTLVVQSRGNNRLLERFPTAN